MRVFYVCIRRNCQYIEIAIVICGHYDDDDDCCCFHTDDVHDVDIIVSEY